MRSASVGERRAARIEGMAHASSAATSIRIENCGVVRILFREEVAALHRLSLRMRRPLPPDAEWTEDATFNAGDAILANPLLKEVYKEAILKGCAFEKAKK